jgi:hypothetical protein
LFPFIISNISAANEDLISASRKLGFPADHPRFQSLLPATRDDPLWNKIAHIYKLEVFELDALKNTRCDNLPSSQAGKYQFTMMISRVSYTCLASLLPYKTSKKIDREVFPLNGFGSIVLQREILANKILALSNKSKCVYVRAPSGVARQV